MPTVPVPANGYTKENLMTTAQKKGGRVDLQSLLVHTKEHPQGRVQIDPSTGLVKNPKNSVLFMKKMKVKADNVVIGLRDIEVNGGHAKAEGSVWRIALAGPAKYHAKVMADDHRFMYQGKQDRTAPELTVDEMKEYQFFRVWYKETQPEIKEGNTAAVDQAFYAWLEAQDTSKIKLLPLVAYRHNASVDSPVS